VDNKNSTSKMKTQISLAIILGLLLLSCSKPKPVNSQSNNIPWAAQSPPSEDKGQRLPIGANMIVGDQIIALEVAQTPQQQEIGLMYRSSLADDRGMLFPFNPPRYTLFWMKNTVIPLDIVFLREGEIRAIYINVPPCKTPSCPTYGPQTKIDQAIELRGGRAQELGLKVGDRLPVKFLHAF
jgi:uncharacterized membrane protein (UPF0127 family)